MSKGDLREYRPMTRGGTFPGKVEYGCLTQSLREGPLDRVYIGETREEAEEDVAGWKQRGIEAKLVTRTIPDWTDA